MKNTHIPNRVFTEKIVVGIQGDEGSFNDEVVRLILSEKYNGQPAEVKFLNNTENVMQALSCGEIDFGQFAICNSLGGLVQESFDATARHTFEKVFEYDHKITHFLVGHQEADITSIKKILSHPQTIKQCSKRVEAYTKKNIKVGSLAEDLIDGAKVAREIIAKNNDPSIATMGCKSIAEIYGLKILESDIENQKENYTKFVWVKRLCTSQ